MKKIIPLLFLLLFAHSSFAADCSESAVNIDNITYTENTTVGSQESISTTGSVVVNDGLQVNYFAPIITLAPGFHAVSGSQFNAVSSSSVVCAVPLFRLSYPTKTALSPLELEDPHNTSVLITIDNPLSYDVFVDYTTIDGTALEGEDYGMASGTAIIKAGDTSAEISIEILGDTTVEDNEVFSIIIFNPTGAGFLEGVTELSRTITIINDDFYTSNVVDTTVAANNDITVSTDLGDITVTSTGNTPVEVKIDNATDIDGKKLVIMEMSGGSATITLPEISSIGTTIMADEYSEPVVLKRTVENYPIINKLLSTDSLFMTAKEYEPSTYSPLSQLIPIDRVLEARAKSKEYLTPPGAKLKVTFSELQQASNLMSVCTTSPDPDLRYEPISCGEHDGKTPVLLIHGFQAELFGPMLDNGKNGGPEYWGDFPSNLLEKGYLPFEFRWSTNAKFEDVAYDLAEAIDRIYTATGKKVHIVAHSFGGLLLRTLLQSEPPLKAISMLEPSDVSGKNMEDIIATVTTVGTPHSGIADSNKTMDGINFPQGQDSDGIDLFKFCKQLSCHLMGEDVVDYALSVVFGVQDEAGEWAAKLYTTKNRLPDLNIQVLIGFSAHDGLFNERVSFGDLLISGYGQRFYNDLALEGTEHDWSSPLLSDSTNGLGEAKVTEIILGRRTINDNNSIWIQSLEPGTAMEIKDGFSLSLQGIVDDFFVPFKHSTGTMAGGADLWASLEVCIGCTIGEPEFHDTLGRVLDWMACRGDEVRSYDIDESSPYNASYNASYCAELFCSEGEGLVNGRCLNTGVVMRPLNDTGITLCGNADNNYFICPVADYPGQDAEYGRDVTHNDDSDGHAGFSFTKLDNNGIALASAAPWPWSCVKDNVTGLIWEVKTDDGGLRDRDWSYTWYNSTGINDGGDAGEANGGSCFDNSNCDTEKYVEQVNQQGLCGSTGWRMPNIKELENIRSLDRVLPVIDTNYFPNTTPLHYWSASPSSSLSDYAWNVYFSYGGSNLNDKRDSKNVRLVRTGE